MRQMTRGEKLILIGIAAASLILRGFAYFRYRFDSDEPQHLHVAWGWTAGLLQYRDLFDNHAPLFHMLTAPILKWVGERPDVLLYMRAPMLLFFAIVIASTYILGRRLYSAAIGAWAALFLALFPVFFLKSLEYRTDNLWNAFWCAALVVMTGGRLTALRIFIAGLLLGCAAATSMKTLLLVLSLGAAAVVTAFLTQRKISLRLGFAALAGILLVPIAIAAYFAANGAWKNLVYCVIEFNAAIASHMPQTDIWVKRLIYVPVVLMILWIAWRKRPADDPQSRWRFFLALTAAFFSASVFGLWILISSRDFLVVFPILAIFAIAAIDRVDIAVPLYVSICLVFAGAIWYYSEHLRNGTEEHITMMRQVLGVTRPEDPILDLKGETIYRRRPYYFIFEFITRRLMSRGLINDTIPEDVIRAQCHVAQADGPFFPPRGRAFLRENFLDLGRIRAAGQWIQDDGSFSVAIPGEYVILNDGGEQSGVLDGSPYQGRRMLAPGRHIFVTNGTKDTLACLWAPAFVRGYSPFHLRDREFAGSPVFDTARRHSGAAPGRRRHRRWRADATRPRDWR
jgi:hypothetical protein